MKFVFQFGRSSGKTITKKDLQELEKRIMKVIDDFIAAQTKFNEDQAVAVDSVVESQGVLGTAVTGLTGDIETLNKKIQELTDQLGDGLTPEQKTALQNLTTAGAAATVRLQAVASAVKANSDALRALDESTPPQVPPPQP